jgi:tRNA pseudouridine38-40 synthase
MLNPFEREYAWHVRGALAVDAMQAAARMLLGRHDFAAFQAADGTQRTTDREIFTSELFARDDGAGVGLSGSAARLITYEICGSGFLRHMVRAIAGSLVEIGSGRRNIEWLSEVVAARDRTRAGPTAPAHGLFLVRVDYDGQTPGS